MSTQSTLFLSVLLVLVPFINSLFSRAPATNLAYRGSGRFETNDEYRGSGRFETNDEYRGSGRVVV
jgi:hypothetical protein